MLASRQNSLKAFHSEEMALTVLGAHACCWMKRIFEVSPCRKAENIMLIIKHFRCDMTLSGSSSEFVNKLCHDLLRLVFCWSGVGVRQPVIRRGYPRRFGPVIIVDLRHGVKTRHSEPVIPCRPAIVDQPKTRRIVSVYGDML